MQNQIIGFFIISTIAFAGLSVVQWKRASQYRDQAAVLRQEAHDEAYQAGMVEAEMRSMERRLKQRDEDTAALTEMVQELIASTNVLSLALAEAREQARQLAETSPADAASGSPAGGGRMGLLSKMLEDPAMQDVIRAQQKMMMDTMYGPLFLELNLDEEQTQKLKSLILDLQMANVKMGTSAISGDESQRQVAGEALSQEKETLEAEVRELLGEDGFTAYQNYQKTMGERVLMNQFKSQLDASGRALSSDQYRMLVEAIVEEKQSAPPDFLQQANDPVRAMEMMQSQEGRQTFLSQQKDINQRLLQKAVHFLSPEQIDSLDKFMENQVQMISLSLEMSQRMAAESGATEAPSPPP